jgi:nucleoside-diphosphate-sugar epimerase
MPTVLITGLNGFVAVHTAVVYLENGWNVRGTVRSQEKGDKVKALPCFKEYQGKVETVILEDLIKGDYTEALKGVDAVCRHFMALSCQANSIADCSLCFSMAFQGRELGLVQRSCCRRDH